MVVFVWLPACHDMTMDTYTHVYWPFIVTLLYGTEIIRFGLTLFGFGDLVYKSIIARLVELFQRHLQRVFPLLMHLNQPQVQPIM